MESDQIFRFLNKYHLLRFKYFFLIFTDNLRFARVIEFILSKYVNIMRTSEGNAVFAMSLSLDQNYTSFQKWILKTIQLLYYYSENLSFLKNCISAWYFIFIIRYWKSEELEENYMKDIIEKSSETSDVKATATDTGYFARSNFHRSLVHKKNFSLI